MLFSKMINDEIQYIKKFKYVIFFKTLLFQFPDINKISISNDISCEYFHGKFWYEMSIAGPRVKGLLGKKS